MSRAALGRGVEQWPRCVGTNAAAAERFQGPTNFPAWRGHAWYLCKEKAATLF
jgi:hypothetical protein